MFTWFKRIGLFLAVNVLILTTLSISVHLILGFFGIQLSGIAYYILLYSILGMGGAFISLWMSKGIAKMARGVKIIPPNAGGDYSKLVDMVHHLARQAGLKTMPEVWNLRLTRGECFCHWTFAKQFISCSFDWSFSPNGQRSD